jgi:hypothetical protein
MKNYFKTKLFFAFSIGVMIGCILMSLTKRNDCSHTGWVKPAEVQKQIAVMQAKYENKVQALLQRNDSLVIKLSQKKTALKKSSDKVLVLQTQVKDLIKDYAAIDSAATETIDTTALLNNCEEMQERVKDLIGENNVKDSIAYSVINTLEDEIKNKDSTIDLHKFQYQLTKSKLSDVLTSNLFLTEQNKDLKKQVKKKRFGNFMLKTGLIILSGITLKSVIH